MKHSRRWNPLAGFAPAFLALAAWIIVSDVQAQFTLDREPPGPSSRKTGLVITEIMYNPRPIPGLNTNLTHEFIEVFNSEPWPEDIGGFSLDGTVRFVFPANTVLPAGGYVVVARVPGLIQTNYGVTNVLGPWEGASTNRLSIEEGTVQLRNRQGAVLLSVNYEDSPPWPEAADGTGHSLSLVRPSYGEDDFRAWAESDSVGGSPGGPDPLTPDPLAAVFINEWQNHSDPVDWIELYNHSNHPIDVSGAWLSDDPATNKFRIPNGTFIPARGFLEYDQNELGFELFAGGETIFFWNSNQTRVIDVIDFRGQSNNVSSGRWPDGGPIQYGLANRTQGGPNSRPLRYNVVISEIMYNPISGNADDEYVEIYNRGTGPVNLSQWEFVVGIDYLFPSNTPPMPPGAYWVIARNPTNLFAIYPNLNTNNTFGPYDGSLANGGERLLLAAADYDIVSATLERLPVPASDLIYDDGGRWGNWSDGQGSSLELIDVLADEHHPSNWADSSDVSESQWTAVEMTVPLGESLGSVINDRVIVMLQGVGECLLDEVEVRVDDGPNLVANGGFENGLAGWTLQGSHDFSTIEDGGFAGAKSLHVRAGSRGDNQSNRILSAPFASPIPPTAGLVSLRAKAKWLRGHPELLLRLHGSATEAYGRLALPRRLGSPGLPNSRRVENAGPAIYEVKHAPILPAADEPVVVTARATDPQTPVVVTLRYRVDPTPAYTGVTMRDDGTGGDAVANDGIYSATIPGQPGGNLVAFYVEGRDNLGAIGTFPHDVFPPPGFTRCWPNDAVARECVVRWGEAQMPGDFATYHLWVTAVNSNRWHTRDTQNNTELDGTFVYNNARVVYNALPLYSGSPWHRTNAITGPAGPNRVDYEMNFPGDQPFLGANDFVLNNPGNPDILTISDLSAVAEQTVYKIFEGLGMVHNRRRYFHFFVNGSQRSTAYERPGNFIFEDSQQPNGDMIEQWFPNDAGGQLFKVEDWFEFENDGFNIAANNDADLLRRTVPIDGQPAFLPALYRFMYRKRSVNVGASANDYSQIFALIDAVSPAENPDGATVDPALLATAVDWEAWMRHFAVQRAVGNWDSYGWERGKNDYLYSTAAGFVHMPWDIDYSLGLGRPANEPLFASNDPRVAAMFNTPEIVRAYWRAFDDLVNGPFRNEHLDPFIDARVAALVANNINIDLDAVARIKTYIGERRAFLQSQLATVAAPFAVEEPPSLSLTENLLVLRGTAPVSVKTIAFNGQVYPITWTSATGFELRVVLAAGVNTLEFQGLDRFGEPVAGAAHSFQVEYVGPVVDPAGAVVLSEIMYTPANPGAQFVEILNRADFNFDLSGWRLEGVNFTFPFGSILTNGQILVLAQDRDAFRVTYGGVPAAGYFGGSLAAAGEVLRLVRPTEAGDVLVDGVRYEAVAPWAAGAAGTSLQLVDASQDNSRPSNWARDPGALATPGAPNSVAATLPAYDALWLNEVQALNLAGPLDNATDLEPWLELYNAGPDVLFLDGYFLADNYGSNLTQWPFPAGFSLAPGEYKILWGDGEFWESADDTLHLPFRFDRDGTLALVRLVNGEPQITDYLTWNDLGANVGYGSFPDGQAVSRTVLHEATPAAGNTNRALRVFINEWLARNDSILRDPADTQFEDWFELYNAEPFAVDLGGFFLTDDLGDPDQFRIPANGRYQIPPGGFLLVWADDEANQNSPARADLHVNFQLGSSSGVLGLYAPDGVTPVDLVAYGQQTNDVSQGRYSDGSSIRYAMTRPTGRGPNGIPGYNTPPVFPFIADLVTAAGRTNTVTIRASDPDGGTLTYSVLEGPAGSQLNQSGAYRWIVPVNQEPGDYRVTLAVTDTGTPPQSDVVTFIITVQAPGIVISTEPVIARVANTGGEVTFTIETIPGRMYRVLYADDVPAAAWTPLGRDFVAANPTASLTDAKAGPRRFYQVLQLD